MIPEKIEKKEKRILLVEKIELLVEYWYNNIEIWKMLWVHKNRISWLRIKKDSYPISLKTLDPLLEKIENILNKINKS